MYGFDNRLVMTVDSHLQLRNKHRLYDVSSRFSLRQGLTCCADGKRLEQKAFSTFHKILTNIEKNFLDKSVLTFRCFAVAHQ